MLTFIVTRLRDGVIVLLLVTFVVFVLGHVVGNPASVMAPQDATEEQIAQLAHQLGLDRPFHEQFASYFFRVGAIDRNGAASCRGIPRRIDAPAAVERTLEQTRSLPH